MGRTRPRLHASVLLADSTTGYLALDLRSRRLHHLNPTAALIVELCDGSRTTREILDLVRPHMDDEAFRECGSWMTWALDARLLTPANGRHSPPSAKELTRLARRLRDDDAVLAAYVCQRHAAEQAPRQARLWYTLGELAHIVGRRSEARAAYERYFAAHPDDAEVGHLLIALRDAAPPPRAPKAFVKQLYSRFASFYDDNMSKQLEYRGPALVHQALAPHLGTRRDLRVLDLGCGTGLAAVPLKPHAKRLVGVDLSPAMIARARRRRIYDALHVKDIVEWLRKDRSTYDIIVTADAMIYFGDLTEVLTLAAKRLARGGAMAITVESGQQAPYRLSDSGRYTHHPDHLRSAAAAAGLDSVTISDAVLRYEYGEPVRALIAVCRQQQTRTTQRRTFL